jgi:hypothetical protein
VEASLILLLRYNTAISKGDEDASDCRQTRGCGGADSAEQIVRGNVDVFASRIACPFGKLYPT